MDEKITFGFCVLFLHKKNIVEVIVGRKFMITRYHFISVYNTTGTAISELQCDICFKTFTAKASVQAHRRLHTGDLPFKCSYCEKRCNSKWNLRCHMIQHMKGQTGSRKKE